MWLRSNPPWEPHVRFRRVQTLVREGRPLVKLRNSVFCAWNAYPAFANCGASVKAGVNARSIVLNKAEQESITAE
jgi:hypothetical protein